ncbi:unnamed protein product [Nippostrongylus brasiliensis]|uniref:Acidic repeat-containing protein-like n=1 Tax=Nippostrongylus brasiliensis TaxID=27835 RepID=A0A0N4YTT8_NIPBR|nr:unnamed protein product [Nippostrongylus brasiliensis]
MMQSYAVATSSEEDRYSCDESDAMQRAFSELSSYYSGLEEHGSTELTSSTDDSGTSGSSDEYDDESDEDYEEESDDDEVSDGEEDEGSEESDESSRSTHPSDTSFELSTLIEEMDQEKLGDTDESCLR